LFHGFFHIEQYFALYFPTVYPIDAYDIPLESCGLGATFSYVLSFQKSYGLRADLNIQNLDFQTSHLEHSIF
jgi:hypothetical protein